MARSVRTLSGVAIAASTVDLVVLATMHVLRTDVDAMTEPTSNYATGDYGVLSSVATFAVGVAALAAAAAFARLLPRSGRRATGVVLLGIYGVAKTVQSFFPIDVAGESTTPGLLHNVLGNLAFFTFPVAAALLSLAWIGAARPAGRFDRVLATIGWAAVPAAVLVLAGDAVGAFGLTQRIFLVLASLFTLVAGARFLTRARLTTG